MSDVVEYRGVQDGQVVFGMSGSGSLQEAVRYARQYALEGRVTVQDKVKGRWTDFMVLSSRKSPPTSVQAVSTSTCGAKARSAVVSPKRVKEKAK